MRGSVGSLRVTRTRDPGQSSPSTSSVFSSANDTFTRSQGDRFARWTCLTTRENVLPPRGKAAKRAGVSAELGQWGPVSGRPVNLGCYGFGNSHLWEFLTICLGIVRTCTLRRASRHVVSGGVTASSGRQRRVSAYLTISTTLVGHGTSGTLPSSSCRNLELRRVHTRQLRERAASVWTLNPHEIRQGTIGGNLNVARCLNCLTSRPDN